MLSAKFLWELGDTAVRVAVPEPLIGFPPFDTFTLDVDALPVPRVSEPCKAWKRDTVVLTGPGGVFGVVSPLELVLPPTAALACPPSLLLFADGSAPFARLDSDWLLSTRSSSTGVGGGEMNATFL